MRFPRAAAWLVTTFVALLAPLSAAQVQLQLEPSAADAAAAARFRQLDTAHLATLARILGLENAGGPIRVVLAPEDGELARDTPPWIAGFAVAARDIVVIFPARAPRYPDESLEAVLNHEIAHILIHRATGGRPVPRWFNEGLATATERAWSFADSRQLAWALASGRDLDLQALDREFSRGAGPAARAYAVSGAFVRSAIERHGPGAPAAILDGVARGLPFDRAWAAATGESLHEAEARFSREILSWDRILPVVTSPFVLWTSISLLALYAIHVHRRRRRARRALWPDDDEGDAEPVPADEERASAREDADPEPADETRGSRTPGR